MALTGCNSSASRSQAAALAQVAAANQYLAQLAQLGDVFRVADERFNAQTSTQLGNTLPAEAQAAPDLAKAATAYADGIAALTPPAPSVSTAQGALETTARTFAADIGKLAAASKAGDVNGAIAAGTAASSLTPRLESANTAVQSAVERAFPPRR